MDRDLSAVLAELAGLLDAKSASTESGHARWAVYQRAMEAFSSQDLLREAVALEPDSSIALSVVLRMLEKVSAEGRAGWVGSLVDEKSAGYASRRALELEVLDQLRGGSSQVNGEQSYDPSWSTWLQLQLAETVVSEEVLVQLVAHGATKKIRHVAHTRLCSLRSRPQAT